MGTITISCTYKEETKHIHCDSSKTLYDVQKFMERKGYIPEGLSVKIKNNSSDNAQILYNGAELEFYKYEKEEIIKDQIDKKILSGKEKCKLLKEIRKEFASINGIPFIPADCPQPDGCIGTCPQCEKEIQFIDIEIDRIIENGGNIIVPNIYLKLIKEFDVPTLGIKLQKDLNRQSDIVISSTLGVVARSEEEMENQHDTSFITIGQYDPDCFVKEDLADDTDDVCGWGDEEW